MASKQTYECYVCKRNGFPETRVFLDGKDENGKTIYKNPDLTPHQHKQEQQSSTVSGETPQNDKPEYRQRLSSESEQSQTEEQQPSLAQILQILQGLESKIDHLTKLVYSQTQQQQQKEQQTK